MRLGENVNVMRTRLSPFSPDHMPSEDKDLDPANLLPFVCRLLPDDPNVEKLERAYKGSIGHGVFDTQETFRSGST